MTLIDEITSYKLLVHEYNSIKRNMNNIHKLINSLKRYKGLIYTLLAKIENSSLKEVLYKQLVIVNRILLVLKIRYLIYAFYKRVIMALLTRLQNLISAIM